MANAERGDFRLRSMREEDLASRDGGGGEGLYYCFYDAVQRETTDRRLRQLLPRRSPSAMLGLRRLLLLGLPRS